jgi:hypothetical protein
MAISEGGKCESLTCMSCNSPPRPYPETDFALFNPSTPSKENATWSFRWRAQDLGREKGWGKLGDDPLSSITFRGLEGTECKGTLRMGAEDGNGVEEFAFTGKKTKPADEQEDTSRVLFGILRDYWWKETERLFYI